MLNIEMLKLWLLRKGVEYTLDMLSKIPEYFESAKLKREQLEKYKKSLEDKTLTEEQRHEADIDFLS